MILVFIEERGGPIKKPALEALSEASRKAGELNNSSVEAVLVGPGKDELAPQIFRLGAAKVYIMENSHLKHYSSSGYTEALKLLIDEIQPEAIFFAATAMGRDLAPRLAAKLGAGVASDCIRVEVREGELMATRPIFAGKALATVRLLRKPAIVTLRPNVFSLEEGSEFSGDVIKKEVSLSEKALQGKVVEILKEEDAALDVTEAEVVVSGGRGMKGPENFNLLNELCAWLPHATVGASRSAVDAGWIDHQHQVGQTGKTVSPNLYLAFGISGAIQHLAGMSSSKYIVAVNKDPEAPIFKVADFGVVGDLFQVIPPLKEELKKRQSG